jgi:uncharacterized SAM-binding protein YcdF (DUF218 family)
MKGLLTEPPGGEQASATEARKKRPRLFLRLGVFAVCTCVIVFVCGFVLFAAHISCLHEPADPRVADGIVVLTGGQSRIEAAVELLKEGKGKRLLISGVNPIAGMEDLRIASGGDKTLFRCCVDIDHEALDTIGNAEQSADWIDRNSYGSLILVTNNYHMPRSMLEMGRLLHDVDLRPYPVVTTPLGHGEWLTNPDALRVMFTEYTKYVAALARGFLPIGPDGPDMHLATATAAEETP